MDPFAERKFRREFEAEISGKPPISDVFLRFDKTEAKPVNKKARKSIKTFLATKLIAEEQSSADLKEAHKKKVEEILNTIAEPETVEEDEKILIKKVSQEQATRLEIVALQSTLETRLQELKARERGICPIRHQIYKQCFDELIRQVTLGCAERGLLLMRCRDEIAMTVTAYETLCAQSIAFGEKNAICFQEEKEALRQKLAILKEERAPMDTIITDMGKKNDQIEIRNAEIQASEDRKYTESIEFLRKSILQYKSQIESIINPKK